MAYPWETSPDSRHLKNNGNNIWIGEGSMCAALPLYLERLFLNGTSPKLVLFLAKLKLGEILSYYIALPSNNFAHDHMSTASHAQLNFS